jgi:hypothetical protein
MIPPTTFIDYLLITLTLLFGIEFLFSLWYFGRYGKIAILNIVEVS